MGHHLSIIRSKTLTHATAWMILENIMRSESQTRKDTHYTIPPYDQNLEIKSIDTVCRLVVV